MSRLITHLFTIVLFLSGKFFPAQSFSTKTYRISELKSLAIIIAGISVVPDASMSQSYMPISQSTEKTQFEISRHISFDRMENDINSANWEDLKSFTREYDALFRGDVMKSAWKQMQGDDKRRGIEISNSFTYDLIGINKAARKEDKEDAMKYLLMVKNDVKDFYNLLVGLGNTLSPGK